MPTSEYVVTGNGVNIRGGPGTEYEVQGTFNTGDVVSVVELAPGFLPILVEPEEGGAPSIGWVSAKYLKKYLAQEPPPSHDGAVMASAVVAKAMTQRGDPYIFGYEVDLKDPNPKAFDCSELVQWVCAQLGVKPTMPDGAANQHDHCAKYGTIIPVATAVRTAGALLFRIGGEYNHVVISRGDGSTIEAKGTAYGVGVFTTAGRGWTSGALIPGVKYE